jgi:lantibiotic modifying enzyme
MNKIEFSTLLNQLLNIDLQEQFGADYSLFTGKMGYLLFLAYLNRCSLNEIQINKLYHLLDDLLNNISILNGSSLAEGTTGLAWVLRYLSSQNLIEIGESTLQDIDAEVYASVTNDIKDSNFDYLYGFGGKLLYLLDMKFDNVVTITDEIINFFYKTAIKTPEGIKWDTDFTEKTNTPYTNLGLAHGQPFIVVLLCKIYQQRPTKDILYLVTESLKWLSKQQKDNPSFYDYDTFYNLQARLGWCYGDLSVAIAYLWAGKVFKVSIWQQEAVKLTHKATQRNLNNSGINIEENNQYIEAGFCHGTAGISFIFRRIYELTQIDVFKRKQQEWLLLTIKQHNTNVELPNIANFIRAEYINKKQVWVKDAGLLEGATGIALTLLSEQYPTIQPTWDKFFLLDFN